LQPEMETVRFYESQVRRYGYGFRALGFGRRSSQDRRFAAAAAIGDLHGRRVLDMGCGFGDFLAWLHERGVRPQYTGVDLGLPMVERCRQRFAGRDDARFVIGDALTWTAEPFDYVVASGIFGYASPDAQKRVQPTLKRLFAMSRVGLAVNFLSWHATTRNPTRLYLRPADVLDYALTLTPAVRLDHSYMPNDFTLSLYRTPAWKEQAQ